LNDKRIRVTEPLPQSHRVTDGSAAGETITSFDREDTAMDRHLQLAVCAFGVLLASACSSPSGTSSYQKPATPADTVTKAADSAANTSEPAGITTAQTPLGTILTDAHGRAVYLFVADKTARSTCIGACAEEWPPLTTTGAPVAGTGVNAALMSTSPRADGTMQLTYNGHPLYYYGDDKGPGTTAGQGETAFGANWYLLTPAGVKIDND
jgi:predicted lipoprotein with Yx(FWY)xxD motif